jgi:hypothetical protein
MGLGFDRPWPPRLLARWRQACDATGAWLALPLRVRVQPTAAAAVAPLPRPRTPGLSSRRPIPTPQMPSLYVTPTPVSPSHHPDALVSSRLGLVLPDRKPSRK